MRMAASPLIGVGGFFVALTQRFMTTAWEAPATEIPEIPENPDDQPLVPPVSEEEPVDVVETPVEPEITTPEPLASEERVELEELRRTKAEQAEQVEINKLADEVREDVATFRTKYAGVYDQETLDTMAGEIQERSIKGVQQRNDLARSQQSQANKTAAIAKYSKQYGIDPLLLQNDNSYEAMEATAIKEKRYLQQEKDIADLKQGRIPRQELDDGAPAGGVLSGEALETYLGTPNARGRFPEMTPDMLKRLDAYHKSQGIR